MSDPRKRLRRAIFATVALGTTATFATITVSPIVAEAVSSPAWSGLPGTASILGTAAGTTVLSRVMARTGRRAGLVAGYAVGIAGAAVALGAARAGSLVLLVAATGLVGFGHGSNQLSRYAAADLVAPERRASALATSVWAGTVGAVLGPGLIAPSAGLAGPLRVPDAAGGYVLTVLFFAASLVCAFSLLRPDPSTLASAEPEDAPAAPAANVWLTPSVQTAVVALLAGQAVMVFVMTMTPVHIRHEGHALGAVGFVMSAHVFGMYAFSPLAGWAADRAGHVLAIAAGLVMLAAAGAAAALVPPHGGPLAAALLLLGLGWSFTFVAGSALLTRGMRYGERARVQGSTDALVWTTAALASVGSGVILSAVGYPVLCLIGAAGALVPLVVVLARSRTVAAVG